MPGTGERRGQPRRGRGGRGGEEGAEEGARLIEEVVVALVVVAMPAVQ